MLQLNLILTFIEQCSIDCVLCYDILLCFLKVCHCNKIIMTLFPLSSVSFFVHTIIAILIRVMNVIAIHVISALFINTTVILMLSLKLISLPLCMFLLMSLKKILARSPSSFDGYASVNYPMRLFGLLKQINFNLLSTMRARVYMRMYDVSIINILHFKKYNKG